MDKSQDSTITFTLRIRKVVKVSEKIRENTHIMLQMASVTPYSIHVAQRMP